MKKAILLTMVAAIVTLTGLALLTWPSSDAEAAICVECRATGIVGPAWGMGSTCNAAVNDAIAEAKALIPGSCFVCGTTPIEVTPCHVCGTYPDDPPGCTGANDWRADYSVSYKCYVETCDPS